MSDAPTRTPTPAGGLRRPKEGFLDSLRSIRGNRLLTLIALIVISLGITSAPVVAAGTTVCIPSCSSTDSRMLSLASVGYETLAGQMITLRIAAPGAMPSFQVSIFDGDTGGNWDNGTTSLVYTLYADPSHNGKDLIQLNQWLGSIHSLVASRSSNRSVELHAAFASVHVHS